MAKIKIFKKAVVAEEPKIKKVEVKIVAPVSQFDPSIPESKQRHLR